MGLRGLRYLIDSFPQINVGNIKNQIDRHRVISFDIFDTLIKRDVQSESDVFSLAERMFNAGSNIKICGYKCIRQFAERLARFNTLDEEITTEMLTNSLVGLRDSNGVEITQDFAIALIKYEQEVEKQICRKNIAIYELFQYCKKNNKRVIIVSDMYWSKSFLRELLHLCEIDGYDELYVSSEYGVKKKNGRLYKVVIKNECVQCSSVLHIGDNKIGDFISAKKEGLDVCLIPKIINNVEYANRVKSNSFEWLSTKSFINNRIQLLDNHNKRIGYEIYGPILYVFVKWLADKLDPTKTVLFCARDCYIVKLAYEMCLGKSSNNVYFLGSRRSLIIPTLRSTVNLKELSALIKSESKKMQISGLLEKIGLDIEDYRDKLAKYNLNEFSVVDRDDLIKSESFVAFYKDIQQDLIKNANNEYSAFLDYWDSLNCSSLVQIVDIGWRGTMQHCLNNLVGARHTIKGFYLGIRSDAVIENYEDVFLNGIKDFEKECFLASMTSLIEIFFSAPHGSVKRYIKDGLIEYFPYECVHDIHNKHLLEDLHQGALQFVNDYSKSILSKFAPFPSELMFSVLREMGNSPKKIDLNKFGNYPFQTGTGVVKNIDSNSVFRYLVNPKKFLFDFARSNWKIGFLKQTLKFKLPYALIFRWIYKHKG